jgi:hypothetical protein
MFLRPPHWWWPLLPLLYCFRRIILVDLSLIEFADWSTSIARFAAWLNVRGLGGRVIIVNPIEHAHLGWRANIFSVEKALDDVHPMREKKSAETYYLGGYLAHRMQVSLARTEYVRLLSAELVGAAPLASAGRGSSSSFVGRALASALMPLLTVLLPFALLAAACRWVRLVPCAKAKRHGGICVDLCQGPGLDKEGRVSRDGRYADTFLSETEGPFRLANHIFLGFGWQPSALADWQHMLALQGATVVGPTAGKTPITLLELLAMVISNVQRWAVLALCVVGPVGGWCLRGRWAHFKYHLDLFRAQLSFHLARPGAYLSRLDYNHRHHALGAECSRLGIHFAGICHSPLGGMAHTPNFGIVSFDTHFTYKPLFWERFYPSWQEARADLRAIGVWRSDFTRQAEAMPGHAASSKEIRQQLGGRFVVAIHLPVPQSYLYDRAVTEKWMGVFADLVRRHRDMAFILFPRRLSEAPDYFRHLVTEMLEPGRCELADTLNPAWTQSYPWRGACDFVVGCTYSDAVLEALACGTPSVSYADVGRGIAELERFDAALSVYDGPTLERVLLLAREGHWPSQQLWLRLRMELVGEADGHCIDRMRTVLLPHLRNIEPIFDPH